MIGHQHIGMQRTTVFRDTFMQPVPVGGIVFASKERCLAAIPTLDDVGGDAGQVEAGFSWQGDYPCHGFSSSTLEIDLSGINSQFKVLSRGMLLSCCSGFVEGVGVVSVYG